MTELNDRALRKADLATGMVVAAVGAATLVFSFRMPTFAERGANPLTAPGIFPAVIGAALLLCGAILAWRTVRSAMPDAAPSAFTGGRAILVSLGLMIVAVALVGRVDFRIVAGAFTLAFLAIFVDWRARGRALAMRCAAVAVTVVLTAIAIPELFEAVFLVRLP